MNKQKVLEQIKGGLIVSCQALKGEPLYIESGSIMQYMARAAKEAGAVGIRANGMSDIKAIKKEVDLPVIGIVKRDYEGFKPFITCTMKEIDELMSVDTDIIAFDCTDRSRADNTTLENFIERIKEKYPNVILMADISNFEEGLNAYKLGVDIVGTTLSGYTEYTDKSEGPDYGLVERLVKNIDIPVIAEGRVHYPIQARNMIGLGAFSIVVGGAITRPLEITQRFKKAIDEGRV